MQYDCIAEPQLSDRELRRVDYMLCCALSLSHTAAQGVW